MSNVEATEVDGERAPSDSAPTTTVTHRYNLLGQRIATDVAADGKPAEPLARYHYNADGSLAETALGPDGLQRWYRYDPLGELTQIADPAMTETLGYRLPGDQGYGDGNITQAAYDLHYTDGVSHTYAYSYDPHDRLTAAHNDQAQLSGSSLESVTYDPNGNIKTERRGDGQTRMYTLVPKTDQIATVTGDGVNVHYTYDAKGRMAGASGDGAPDVASLDYDPLTNLPRHVLASDGVEMDYHYDVHNRRVAKVGHRVNGADATRVYYRGQGATALAELAGDDAALEPQTYVRGPGGLQAVTLQGQRYFVSRDHLGSTRALMDTTGKVAAYFNYTPFGALMPGNSQDDGGLAAYMAYRFAGTEYDPETGLYNNRARWYDPVLGRFLTPDPDHQYPSPYVYVGNNAVNGVDPTGLSSEGEEINLSDDDSTEIGGGGNEDYWENIGRGNRLGDGESEEASSHESFSSSSDSTDGTISLEEQSEEEYDDFDFREFGDSDYDDELYSGSDTDSHSSSDSDSDYADEELIGLRFRPPISNFDIEITIVTQRVRVSGLGIPFNPDFQRALSASIRLRLPHLVDPELDVDINFIRVMNREMINQARNLRYAARMSGMAVAKGRLFYSFDIERSLNRFGNYMRRDAEFEQASRLMRKLQLVHDANLRVQIRALRLMRLLRILRKTTAKDLAP